MVYRPGGKFFNTVPNHHEDYFIMFANNIYWILVNIDTYQEPVFFLTTISGAEFRNHNSALQLASKKIQTRNESES